MNYKSTEKYEQLPLNLCTTVHRALYTVLQAEIPESRDTSDFTESQMELIQHQVEQRIKHTGMLL